MKKPDKHILYEASVQSVDEEIHLLKRFYRTYRKQSFTTLREDFCGTAALSCEWVRRHPDHYAWGVDLNPKVLQWAGQYNLSTLSPAAAKRIVLRRGNVLSARTSPTDVTVAFNFSYCVFKERALLIRYFKQVYQGLNKTGLFAIDVMGGTESMSVKEDTRRVPAFTGSDGKRYPPFTYKWEQQKFNAINHHILCHIHFKPANGLLMRRAFTYDWRLWTVPELRECLTEAGFTSSYVFVHGFDEDGDSDEIYRRRSHYENKEAWVAYVVALK